MDAIELKVTPGDVTVAKGDNVTIQAMAMGFDPQRATVHLRYSNGTEWETSSMEVTPQNVPTFRHLVFNLQEPLHYFVDAAGYRSKEFTIDVADLPRVEKIDYTYHYPAYTGLAVKKEENATDIVALKGTEVEVTVTGSQPLTGGRFVFADGKSCGIAADRRENGHGTRNRRPDSDLPNRTDEQGSARAISAWKNFRWKCSKIRNRSSSSPNPAATAKPPMSKKFSPSCEPRTISASTNLELHFSVNGGEDQTRQSVRQQGRKAEGNLGRPHLLPGRIQARAGRRRHLLRQGRGFAHSRQQRFRPTFTSLKSVRSAGNIARASRAAVEAVEAAAKVSRWNRCLRRQKDIISATHKLINNKDKFKTKEWTDNIHAIGANQAKAAEQTNTLVERMSRRGLTNQDKMIRDMAENLKKAIEQMNPAAEQLKGEEAEAAEPFEQRALQYLMRADALFTEIQVTMGGGGGGGGGGQQNAQDLADLFELELDQNKNQYETVQRGEMQQNSQEVDEALRKLKELAERQQKLQERRARQQQQGGGGGGGADQMTAQELQKETERLARQLDKLSRENNDRQMADAARALQQAAQNMQQQAQSGSPCATGPGGSTRTGTAAAGATLDEPGAERHDGRTSGPGCRNKPRS